MFNLRTWFTAALLASTTLATPALAADTAPSALVRVAPPVHRTLSEQLTGYGTVSAATGEASDLALPRAGRLPRPAVNARQRVTRGTGLVPLATGARDALPYRQAPANLAPAREPHPVPVVPPSAFLRLARGAYLLPVLDGQAVRVAVKPGIEADGLIAVRGPLDPTLPVVTLGNYELRDGMAVREAQR